MKNLVSYAMQLGLNFGNADSKSHERVGSSIVKKVMEERGESRGEAFTLATGTWNMRVRV